MLGSKPPLQTKQVRAIRTKLQVEHRLRDLAMFNLAIDSKLRGCDLDSCHHRTLRRGSSHQLRMGACLADCFDVLALR